VLVVLLPGVISNTLGLLSGVLYILPLPASIPLDHLSVPAKEPKVVVVLLPGVISNTLELR